MKKLVGLLEQEPALRGSPSRAALFIAIAGLEAEAITGNAPARTLNAIRAAMSLVDLEYMSPKKRAEAAE
ncbi:hypothetical protein [Methylobacterium sp. A54F]